MADCEENQLRDGTDIEFEADGGYLMGQEVVGEDINRTEVFDRDHILANSYKTDAEGDREFAWFDFEAQHKQLGSPGD